MIRTDVIALVVQETRLQGLLARWGTKGAAKFRLVQAHAHEQQHLHSSKGKRASSIPEKQAAEPLAESEFAEYEAEEESYQTSLEHLKAEIDLGYPISVVDRRYLATYDFRGCLAVVVVGRDGLVANAAKYVGDVPIIAVNPDPQRIDGILLPFKVGDVRGVLQRLLQERAKFLLVSLAEATLNDGQRLLAFNDLFIGCSSHTSARYMLTASGRTEPHSSSGIIVATGAGSTGWLSSVFNMYNGIARWVGGQEHSHSNIAWDDPRLAWVVREPFRSKLTDAELVGGLLNDGDEMRIESMMESRGVIFSDGVESDFLEFNSGTIARIGRSKQQARLVVR